MANKSDLVDPTGPNPKADKYDPFGYRAAQPVGPRETGNELGGQVPAEVQPQVNPLPAPE